LFTENGLKTSKFKQKEAAKQQFYCNFTWYSQNVNKKTKGTYQILLYQ